MPGFLFKFSFLFLIMARVKNVHFLYLYFLNVCQVKSTGFGVVSSMSATDLWFEQKRALQNRNPEGDPANFSTYVLITYYLSQHCWYSQFFPLNFDMSHQVLICGSLVTESRLFLVGSSLNGFGTRSSDGDLCLVVKDEPVSNSTLLL